MTVTNRPIVVHAIGVLITILGMIINNFRGIIIGLLVIAISDGILLLEDWYGRRDQDA